MSPERPLILRWEGKKGEISIFILLTLSSFKKKVMKENKKGCCSCFSSNQKKNSIAKRGGHDRGGEELDVQVESDDGVRGKGSQRVWGMNERREDG